ncbi:hypothetical protein HZS_507 [Henneguya salminicola]|nr:hypothetical protein HZS_507 [Henneguya salminicola]
MKHFKLIHDNELFEKCTSMIKLLKESYVETLEQRLISDIPEKEIKERLPCNEDEIFFNKICLYTSSILTPQPFYYDLLKNEISKIHDIIKSKYKDCLLLPFGSFSTGLNWWVSDIDLALLTYLPVSPVTILKKISFLLSTHDFKIKLFVEFARVPVLKFMSVALNVEFDLSINNGYAIYNSLLIRTYSHIYPDHKALYCCIKLCFVNELMLGHHNKQLNSYSISIMLIYFLQHSTEKILPFLQNTNTTDIHENIMDILHFETNISELNKDNLVQFKKDSSVGKNLIEFFKFYSKFNFKNNIIAIDGRNYPPCENFNGFINIRDPFIPSFNLGRNLKKMDAFKLKMFLQLKYQQLHEALHRLNTQEDIHKAASYLFEKNIQTKLSYKYKKQLRHEQLEKRKFVNKYVKDEEIKFLNKKK